MVNLQEEKLQAMTQKIIHRAESRGHANHGWLDTYHTFSFASYYNPERMHFGVLRVLNDDTVAGGMGFGTHPHENMEIVSIPLEGDLEHRDSMGNISVIKAGDIQVMSAGTGVYHSEFNRNKDQLTRFLQIWIFPRQKDVKPRYDQRTLDPAQSINQLQTILAPEPHDNSVWIHQDAWFFVCRPDAGVNIPYTFKREGNGLYVFVLEGSIQIAGETLNRRDGMGISGTNNLQLEGLAAQSHVLLMEVPLQ